MITETIDGRGIRVDSPSFSQFLGDDFAVGFPARDVGDAIRRLEVVAINAPSPQMAEEARTLIALLKTKPQMSRDAELLGTDNFAILRVRRDLKWKNGRAQVVGCDSLRLLTLLVSYVASNEFDMVEGYVLNLKKSGIPVQVKDLNDGLFQFEIFDDIVTLCMVAAGAVQ